MSNKKKALIIALIIIIVMLIMVYVYRYFLEFRNSEVKALLKAEAAQFPGDEDGVYKLLHDGVNHILNSRTATSQVRNYAAKAGISKEKALVDAAVIAAQNNKFLS